jgi:XTP/dITP diphosphohydrolase
MGIVRQMIVRTDVVTTVVKVWKRTCPMPNRPLLIATRSKGKLPEIVAALTGLPVDLLSLSQVPDLPPGYDVEEPAMTFEGNAIIKAMTVGNRTGYLTLADDAGLEVDALQGRPGVMTKRYAPGTDADRYRKLLGELDGVPTMQRTARFRAVIAMYDPATSRVRTCEGVYAGRIAETPRGVHGFGYDPVFYDPQRQKTAAEMHVSEKNEVSHRGQALKRAYDILQADFLR